MKRHFGVLTWVALLAATLAGQTPGRPGAVGTTLVDTLEAPWAVALLPGGKMLVTERLPGRMRILDANGTLSKPLAGVGESQDAADEQASEADAQVAL